MSKKKTAIYCRIASMTECDHIGMEQQKEGLVRFAKEQGYQNIECYCDLGCSGMTIKGRIALEKLLQDVKAGEVKRVIVRSISRLSRDLADGYRLLNEFNINNVDFIMQNDPGLNVNMCMKKLGQIWYAIGENENE